MRYIYMTEKLEMRKNKLKKMESKDKINTYRED